MTPKEAVEQARELLDLRWTNDDQVEKAAKVVEILSQKMASPEGFLRTAQVLWLPDSASGVAERPSILGVLNIFRQNLPTLVQRETSLGWARAMVWAAVRLLVESKPVIAAVATLARSSADWSPVQERQRTLNRQLVVVSSRANEDAYALEDPGTYQPFGNWPSDASLGAAKAWSDVQAQLAQSPPTSTTLHAAITALHARSAQKIDGLDELVKALRGAIDKIESHIVVGHVPTIVSDELNLLWWGQSLYSGSLQLSYRDVPAEHLPFWMAEDMSRLGDVWPSEAKVAYCTESLRKLLPSIDEKVSIRDHASRLIDAVVWASKQDAKAKPRALPAWMSTLVEEEATGLPISLLVCGAAAGKNPDTLLERLKAEVGLDLSQHVSFRTWASWIYRERLLGRFLAEAWPKASE